MQQHEAPVEGSKKVVIVVATEMTADMVKSALVCSLCTVCSSPACVSVTVAECQGAGCWCWPTVTPLFAPPSAACLMTPVQPSIYPC